MAIEQKRANHHRPEKPAKPPAPIEAAYHMADAAIQNLLDLVAA